MRGRVRMNNSSGPPACPPQRPHRLQLKRLHFLSLTHICSFRPGPLVQLKELVESADLDLHEEIMFKQGKDGEVRGLRRRVWWSLGVGTRR